MLSIIYILHTFLAPLRLHCSTARHTHTDTREHKHEHNQSTYPKNRSINQSIKQPINRPTSGKFT